MNQDLSNRERKKLRKLAHSLKPIVMIGQHGFSVAVVSEIDTALIAHELIKIRVRGFKREERQNKVEEIAKELNAQIVSIVGGVVTMFREASETD
jgi:RNA-binding protein